MTKYLDYEGLKYFIGKVKGLIGGKADKTHYHNIQDVNNLQTALNGKANSSHSHSISDVNNLQTTLNNKANSSHSHSISNISGLQTALNGKASSGHTHSGMVKTVGSIKADNIAVISKGGSTSEIPNNTLIFELE